jgi:hypothetical protein
MEFRRIVPSNKNLEIYVHLMQQCFKGKVKYDFNYMKWLYVDNPDGEVVGFDAFEGEQITAHYACIPTLIRLFGEKVLGLLSINTATHPDFRSRGLFTELAEMTYQLADQKGFACVYGVANANSTPGFIGTLNFKLIQPLEARIGIGDLKIDVSQGTPQFCRLWRYETLNWRTLHPSNPVFVKKEKHILKLYANSISRFIPVYAELPISKLMTTGDLCKSQAFKLSPLRLFMGLIAGQRVPFNKYFPIPNFLKPSPLNFIFRPLGKENKTPEKEMVNISFADFDAY